MNKTNKEEHARQAEFDGEPPEGTCWACGKTHDNNKPCEELLAPNGRCEKCKQPLQACEPHFQGGTYCNNPDCEECV